MKFLIMGMGLAITLNLSASIRAEQEAQPERMIPIPLVDVVNNAFGPGETLKFVIKYEFISAGEASLVVKDGGLYNNRPTYLLESVAESNNFIDAFFKVRDFNASRVDQWSLASVQFHQNLREGHYKVVRNTTLDYQTGRFKYERQYKGKTSVQEGDIDFAFSDILSSFFYARTLPLKLGNKYAIKVFSDNKYYDLEVEVLPELDTIKVPAGNFECIVIKPQVVGDAIFKAKEGRMNIWLTNDTRRMPVLLRSRVFIGAFDAELLEFTPPSK
jgi:hypothetical protein